MNPLTEEQKARVDASMAIADRAATVAARKRPAHEHQVHSAATEGLMRAAESYDRLGIRMPWDDWAAVCVNRAITNYFNSRFGRRFRREVRLTNNSDSPDPFGQFADPKGEYGLQMADIYDLFAKIPTYEHGLLARKVVFEQMSQRDAGRESGFHCGNGPRAWGKIAANLARWGAL